MIVGSNYFFKDIPGFTSKDIDYLYLVENPTDFKDWTQLSGHGKCIFQWRLTDANEMVNLHLKYNCPMSVGKFLVKDFVNQLKITNLHLQKLKPLFDNLDDKHKYLQVLYKWSIENEGSVEFPKEILEDAYKEYKKYR